METTELQKQEGELVSTRESWEIWREAREKVAEDEEGEWVSDCAVPVDFTHKQGFFFLPSTNKEMSQGGDVDR